MWKVITSSNLNLPLKLLFYLLILTNNNLLLKIYYENIVKILWQYFSIRIFYFLYYFSSFHFIFIHISFLFFLFSFSCFSPPHKTHSPLLFIFFFTSRSFQCFTSKRERGMGLHCMHLHRRSLSSPPIGLGQIGFFSFFLFFCICLF